MEKKKFIITEKSGLILEGGGMRGIFTIGVLDNLMDRGIRFPYIIGVSAGACNGLSYMSHQRGRAKYADIDLLMEHNYIGLKYLFTQGNIMDFKLLFHTFPEKIYPYDYDRLASSPEHFEMVTTSCKTGKACYFGYMLCSDGFRHVITPAEILAALAPATNTEEEPMNGHLRNLIELNKSRNENDNITALLIRTIQEV